jgi:homoserine O-acetyltransferase
VKRFDANSYLLIVKAIQEFNLAEKYGQGSLEKAFELLPKHLDFLIVGIDSDVCFYVEEQEEIVNALKKNSINCTFEIVHSLKGHDSFLLEPERYYFLRDFLEKPAKAESKQ